MDPSLYPQMAALEKKHWWFSARRSIINHLLNKLNLPPHTQILDAGCGTGGNLSMLSQHGEVCAMELNDAARNFASQNARANVWAGSLPDDIPFQAEQFDLIVLFDVLEHLQEDSRSLQSLYTHLKSDGRLLITVPALPLLWSEHDEMHHHYRRYLKKDLCSLLEQAGYQVSMVSYFNFFLFPMIFAVRYWHRFFKRQNNKQYHDLTPPPPSWLNWLFEQVFASERYLINRIPLPIGVSLILLAQKKI